MGTEFLFDNLKERNHLEDLDIDLEDSTKVYIKEIMREDINSIKLAKDRAQQQVLEKTAMNLPIPYTTENILTS
jgi:hypothetical protein